MRIILSPAKQMLDIGDGHTSGMPVYIEKAEEIKRYMQGLSYKEAKSLWGCNDKLAMQNYARFEHMDLKNHVSPAILSYDGIAFKYMCPNVFQYGEFDYVEEHLRILSGFYGVLKPLDGVVPYRLEMQARAKVAGKKNLYDYWGDLLYKEVVDDSHIILNLASKEYSKCIEKYLTPEDTYITCVFGEYVGEKIVQKGVYAKMARGEMVRYLAENHIEELEAIKGFDRLGFSFEEAHSDDKTYTFIRKNESDKDKKPGR